MISPKPPVNRSFAPGPVLKTGLFALLLAGMFQTWKPWLIPPAPEPEVVPDQVARTATRTDYETFCTDGLFGPEVYLIRRQFTLSEYTSGLLTPEEKTDTFYLKTLNPGEMCPPYAPELLPGAPGGS